MKELNKNGSSTLTNKQYYQNIPQKNVPFLINAFRPFKSPQNRYFLQKSYYNLSESPPSYEETDSTYQFESKKNGLLNKIEKEMIPNGPLIGIFLKSE